MLNANPTLSPEEAVAFVRRLHDEGFNSIRFNPYLWPEGRKVSRTDSRQDLVGVDGTAMVDLWTVSVPTSQMDDAVGRAMYEEAGRLGE